MEYLTKRSTNLFSLIQAIKANNFQEIIMYLPFDNWKETLNIIISHTNKNQLFSLCTVISEAFENKGEFYNSLYFALFAKDLIRTISILLNHVSNDIPSMHLELEKILIILYGFRDRNNVNL